MTYPYKVIIPARYAATRLPGKALEDIAGKPLLQHVYETAVNSRAESVIIATDDVRIGDCARDFGAEVIMTSGEHTSGTERLAEAVETTGETDNSIIVNLQGDEIGMPGELLDQVADLLSVDDNRKMATLCEVLDDETAFHDPNIVKVVFDQNGVALYFSRAPIPWPREPGIHECYRHIGLYAYRVGFLKEFRRMQKPSLEIIESLEQLRALYYGENIYIDIARVKPGHGIDTPGDLARARKLYTSASQT
ncbi:MAG TPA: 3-deoxy-manno-octulosonate cytidylyltransferase [Gammaproteobacteria bacterium]|nr:3-deoxy-manno-octulosonate cytidylyltransferase [Gammaproteobacteria bacterium]